MTSVRIRSVFLAALVTLVVGGCAALDGMGDGEQTVSKEDLIRRDRPHVDPRLLPNPMEGNASKANEPVMSLPPRANAGVIGEISPRLTGTPGSRVSGVRTASGSGPGAASGAPGAGEQPVELSFMEASLRSVIELLFEQYIPEPYTFLPDFKDQTVSWIVSGSYDRATILRMVEAFLDLHGVTLVKQGNVYAVSSGSQRPGQPTDLGQTSGIWRLRYIDAKDVITIGRQYLSKPDRLQVVDSANMVIAIGSGPEIINLDKFLADVDVPVLQDRRIVIYGPRFLSPQAVVSLLQNLPKAMGLTLSGDSKKLIEAEVATNAQRVIIVTKGEEIRDAVLAYLEQVDRPGKESKQVFVASLRTQKASELKTTVEQMLTPMFQEREKIILVADVATNSLLVTATPDEFYEIRRLIDRLDVTAPSVLIESSIISVELNESMAYGVEWFLSGQMSDARADVNTGLRNTNISLSNGLASVGSTIGLVSLTDNAFAALDLLAANTSLQVLSRPRVLVKNNEEATIKSTKEVRLLKAEIPTNQSVGGTTQISNQYETKEVGVTLVVTPNIGADGSVTLQIKIEDSAEGSVENGQPTFNKREVKSRFVVNHGETVFIGGLIKRQNKSETNKIPGFGDIPIVGNIFSNNSSSEGGSELIVLVTPYVITDQYAARLVTEAFTDLKEAR